LNSLFSVAILYEIERVLRYPKVAALHHLPESELQEFLRLLAEEGLVIEPAERLLVSPDETDNRYIECALAGRADYLVTADKLHLLPIGDYEGIQIVSPARFLAVLQLGSRLSPVAQLIWYSQSTADNIFGQLHLGSVPLYQYGLDPL
jgi:putative PIN family toxin of toxin-antitoxin system